MRLSALQPIPGRCLKSADPRYSSSGADCRSSSFRHRVGFDHLLDGWLGGVEIDKNGPYSHAYDELNSCYIGVIRKNCYFCYMKRISSSLSLLLVTVGLFSCLALTAQQYHDAAAFGLKGNVKECKVEISGKESVSDPYDFTYVSFTRNGELSVWGDGDEKFSISNASGISRSEGWLTGFTYKKGAANRQNKYHYESGALAAKYFHSDARLPYTGFTLYSTITTDAINPTSFIAQDSDKSIYVIVDSELSKETIDRDRVESRACKAAHLIINKNAPRSNYVVKQRDSHGNYTVLLRGDGVEIKRIITYWDDEPISSKQTQMTTEPVTEMAGIKLTDSKELTLKDLISKPLGVIDNPSKSIWDVDPDKVIEFIQGNKEWKYSESYGSYNIEEGFNRSFKGYPLKARVSKYDSEYVSDTYGYSFFVTMGYNDQETEETASREMKKLYDSVVQEFHDLGIDLTQSGGESWTRAEKTIGDKHYLVALYKPVVINGKISGREYYVSIVVNKPK